MKVGLQRVGLILVTVVVVLIGHRLIPPSMGIIPRIFAISALLVVVLWLVSYTIRFWQRPRAGR
jgi:hypothetical protein